MNRRDAIKRTSLLLGIAVSSPVVVSLLGGCSPNKEINWIPSFLSKDQSLLVSELSETILPKTDTPGAIDIGVDAFIDKMVGEVYIKKEQNVFIEGLKKVNQLSQEVGKDIFINLPENKRHAVLEKLEDTITDYDKDRDEHNQPFYSQFKELTLLGYFTSEEIMTNQLKYVPIPARLNGCVDMENNQKLIVGNHI